MSQIMTDDEFEEVLDEKYANHKNVKKFMRMALQHYEGKEAQLLKLLEEPNTMLESVILSPLDGLDDVNQEFEVDVSHFFLLLHQLIDTLYAPLMEGRYHDTLKFPPPKQAKPKPKPKSESPQPQPSKRKSKSIKVTPAVDEDEKTDNAAPPQKSVKPKSKPESKAASAPKRTKKTRQRIKRPPKSDRNTNNQWGLLPENDLNEDAEIDDNVGYDIDLNAPEIVRKRTMEAERKERRKMERSQSRIDKAKYMKAMEKKKEVEKQRKAMLATRKHPLEEVTSLSQYLDNYHHKLVDHGLNQNITLPVLWKCLFYHESGREWQFEELVDVDDDTELNEAWADAILCSCVPTYEEADDDKDDESGSDENDNADEESKLGELPEFVHVFAKAHDYVEKYLSPSAHKDLLRQNRTFEDAFRDSDDDGGDAKANEDRETIFVYRLRRWMPIRSEEGKKEKNRRADRDTYRYGWRGDRFNADLDQFILCDDLICIQNRSCLEESTWFKWLREEDTQLTYVKDSGFFQKTGAIQGYDADGKVLAGVSRVGDFILGCASHSAQQMYGVIRFDTLAPAVCRFAFITPPTTNLGGSNYQNLIYNESETRMPPVESSGLWFNNLRRYLVMRGTEVGTKVNVGQAFGPGIDTSEMEDVWTLAIAFSHPIPSEHSSMLVYKKGSLEIELKATFALVDNMPVFEEEYLIVRIEEKSVATMPTEVANVKIRSNIKTWRYTVDGFEKEWGEPDTENTHVLIVSKSDDGMVTCVLNGRYVTLSDDAVGNTHLLDTKKSNSILLGHKCAGGEFGTPISLFNGHILQLALYPFVFHEFELREYYEQFLEHTQTYQKTMDKNVQLLFRMQ